ncbi:REP-associated tyrosine transposase [Undibacterium parvum]|uniref:Transposase n=1 Tax=Undibacterium parvum TaxID=401471 RepID=A0A3Q9BSK3_9BURK|nr:transposase [Undibacterium parvum]AZP13295.1 transposase [Undibacterium parvum]
MRTYKRARIPGATYFFTVNLAERHGEALLTQHIHVLRAAFQDVMQKHPFTLVAIVVLPEHLHCIWRLPPEDSDFPMRWRLIKADFSRALAQTEPISASRVRKGERGIWQRRYWEHVLRDELDLQRHLDYIHYNPVKHGYVERASEWPHSSFQRYVERGYYPENWAAALDVIDLKLDE